MSKAENVENNSSLEPTQKGEEMNEYDADQNMKALNVGITSCNPVTLTPATENLNTAVEKSERTKIFGGFRLW